MHCTDGEWRSKQTIIWLTFIHVVNTSALQLRRVRPLFFTVALRPLLDESGIEQNGFFVVFFKRDFSASSTHSIPLSFLCSFQKVQHHHSTGAAAAVQGRLLCRVRWIPSSSWPDRGYHRDVCSVGLKDQHSLPRNTRVQGTGAELLIALFSSNNSREENIRHSNASHCHYFFQLMEDQILQKYRKYKKVKKVVFLVVVFLINIAHKTLRHHNFCKSVLWTWSCHWSLCNYTDCQKRGKVSFFSVFIGTLCKI